MVHKTPHYFRFTKMPYSKLGKKLLGRLVSGTCLTFLNCEFEKGAVVAQHKHASEQISYIAKGVLKATVADKEYILRKGDAILIPPHTPHGWVALQKSETLEMFSPINLKVIRMHKTGLKRPRSART